MGEASLPTSDGEAWSRAAARAAQPGPRAGCDGWSFSRSPLNPHPPHPRPQPETRAAEKGEALQGRIPIMAT